MPDVSGEVCRDGGGVGDKEMEGMRGGKRVAISIVQVEVASTATRREGEK